MSQYKLLRNISCILTSSLRKAHNDHTYRVFSGIQPTGVIHIGNYFGAIKEWLRLQNLSDHKCIFSLVDLHAITIPLKADQLRGNIYEMLACLLASGLDPNKCTIYRQSDILAHGQLAWILTCHLTMPRLYNIPQFKEKSEGAKETPLGLYMYPVLQAADIMLFKANLVPAGEDQTAHMGLTQHLARKFNNRAGYQVFPIPVQVVSSQEQAKIRSLRNVTKKMSKSDPDHRSRICLMDSDDHIRDCARKAVTDSISEITYNPETRPGVSNLLSLYSAVDGRSVDQLVKEFQGQTTAQFKVQLGDVLVQFIKPIREETKRLLQDKSYLDGILKNGAEKLNPLAHDTMKEVQKVLGFI